MEKKAGERKIWTPTPQPLINLLVHPGQRRSIAGCLLEDKWTEARFLTLFRLGNKDRIFKNVLQRLYLPLCSTQIRWKHFQLFLISAVLIEVIGRKMQHSVFLSVNMPELPIWPQEIHNAPCGESGWNWGSFIHYLFPATFSLFIFYQVDFF